MKREKKHFEYDVFVSYSRKNSVFAKRLVADLMREQINVWFDTQAISVGDQYRKSIEQGIEKSRFFCFVMSTASLRSNFIMKQEVEPALVKMAQENRARFVLPIKLKCQAKIPAQLATYQYIDFSKTSQYRANFRKLVDAISMTAENFTGARLYKNVDTLMTGTMVGVGTELHQAPYSGSYVRVFFQNGRIRTMETYTDRKPDGVKSVNYDTHGRVAEIVLFRNNQVIDTWHYEYDRRTGLRRFKWVERPGKQIHLRMEYDREGMKISEAHVNAEKKVVAGPEAWALKKFDRDTDGRVVRERYFDAHDREISVKSGFSYKE